MTRNIHNLSDREELQRLLQLFMDGATSLEEESLLAEYFCTHGVDDELSDYRDMFVLFESGELPPMVNLPSPGPVGPREVEPHFTRVSSPARSIVSLMLRYAAVAASVVVAFFVGMYFAPDDSASSPPQTELMQTAMPVLYGITDEEIWALQEDVEREFERMTREMDLFQQELMN